MTRGRSGFINQSFIRAEINELNNIQHYCKTDYFDVVNIPDHINLIQKRRAILNKKADKTNPGVKQFLNLLNQLIFIILILELIINKKKNYHKKIKFYKVF